VSEAFDPYYKWLAIPPKDQPPNHYRLLGIELFETDPDVVSNAADMRMTLVRSFQGGKHEELSQKLLNEISAARICLLDPAKREEYDLQLRSKLPAKARPRRSKPPKLPSRQGVWSQSLQDQQIEAVLTPCWQCHEAVRRDAEYCPQCGAMHPALRRCPSCQELVRDETAPCPHCGAIRVEVAPGAAGVDQAPHVAEGELDWTDRAKRYDAPPWLSRATGAIAAALDSARRAALALPRWADDCLRALAGEDNTILHNFLRGGAVLALLGALIAVVWLFLSGSSQPVAGTPGRPSIAAANSGVASGSDAGTNGPEKPWEPPPVDPNLPRTFTNTIGMAFVLIPPGEFLMGASPDEKAGSDELPRHPVRITRPFYMSIHEVTQQQYERVTGKNPSRFSQVPGKDTGGFPVEMVSWNDAAAFCEKLSAASGEAGRLYRLPSEAEWEYACRAGTETRFHVGSELTTTDADIEPENPRDRDPRDRRPNTVGSYRPNAWGLFDMHGNVWEWCADRYGADYYQQSDREDPKGPASGAERVVRGGGWRSDASKCRSANRSCSLPDYPYSFYGFRVVCFP